MDYDILFLGKLFPRETEAEIKQKMKTGMQDAANALQWHLIDGLDENNCGTIRILDYLPVDSYPRGYTERRIPEYGFQHCSRYSSGDKVVGCTNLTVVKQLCNQAPFRREIRRWIGDRSGRRKIILSYTASPMFLSLVRYAKKRDSSILAACVIADLPEFLSARKLTGLLRIYNAYEAKKSAGLYRYVDRFILLTRYMADRLQITAPFMVMEGIATEETGDQDPSLAEEYRSERYVFYSGILNYSFGIRTLLEAFDQIPDPDLKLLICGFGEAEQEIRSRMDRDSRIVFLGRIDRKQVIPLQRGAAVLVNPRQNTEEFTRYSFPSKNLEYLSSGVPVVAYKLDGIPDEYDEWFHYPADRTPGELARRIRCISDMDPQSRAQLGMRARDFVLKSKNQRVQTARILKFLAD